MNGAEVWVLQTVRTTGAGSHVRSRNFPGQLSSRQHLRIALQYELNDGDDATRMGSQEMCGLLTDGTVS